MLGDDLWAFVVLVLFVFRPVLFLEGYVLIADRDRAVFVVLTFFWIKSGLVGLNDPVRERLDIREFPVGLTRFFPEDDRTDCPAA